MINHYYYRLYIILVIIVTIPILFSKINLVGNHEIASFLLSYDNFLDFITNHKEVNFLLDIENNRFRPIFYLFKGAEYFLLKDNHFFSFLIRYILIIVISLNLFSFIYFISKDYFITFLISAFIIFFPTNYDIFYRLDVQEFYFLLFFSFFLITFVEKYKNLNKDFIRFLLLILIIGTKENFVFHVFLFFVINKLLKNDLIIFNHRIYFRLIFLFIFSFFLKFYFIFNIFGSKAYQLSLGFEKYLSLIFKFPTQNLINFIYLILVGFFLNLFLRKKIAIKHLKIFLILSGHLFLDYFFYQGLSSYRHYLISILVVGFLSLIILTNYKKELFLDNKFLLAIFSFSSYLSIITLFIITFFLNLKTTTYNIKENQHSIIIHSDRSNLLVIHDEISEKVISLAYFSKFYNPNKKVFFHVIDNNKSINDISNQAGGSYDEFYFSKINKVFYTNKFTQNQIISQNIGLCVIFDKKFKKNCGKSKILIMPEEIHLIIDNKINLHAFN